MPGYQEARVMPRRDPAMSAGKCDLLGLSRAELKQALVDIQIPAKQVNMRTKQLWHWLYHRGATDFAAMDNISKDLRTRLSAHFTISRPDVTSAQISVDGTRKWLMKFADGSEAEAVFIPDEDRGTLCISSQVGCTLNCAFCHTGTQKLVRNLTAGEIVGQFLLARDDLGEWTGPTEGRLVTNIVLMGMGEPLYNFDQVKQAMHIVMDEEGIQLSRRRITLSTAGVIPMMQRAGDELGVNLAVSLHAVNNKTRDEVVPLNRKFKLEDLLDACANYPGAHNARRITFEYVMLKDVNDSDADARELVRLLKAHKIPAKVNLIPFNPWPGAPYECSDDARIKRFSDIVYKAGISAPVRTPRGRDIMAACGQLKSETEKVRATQRKKLTASNAAH
ncbi:MAG: 23S rRNA (adenine(2503)-C(2))-methyltransferase RlmN [Pseudomonadota bacterium]